MIEQKAFVGVPDAVLDRWANLEARPRIIVDLHLNLVWSNAAADTAMAEGREVALRDGGFVLVDGSEMAGLRAFVAGATELVSAWCSTAGDGEAVLFRGWRIESAQGPLVGIVFHPSGVRYAPHWADFSRVFGLTLSEFKVALRLLDGIQIEAVSEELGIAIGTARIHVRNLYGKLQVSSREAMFRLLAPFRVA